MKPKRDLIHRWEGNPIITVDDIPFPCGSVFNAGAAFHEGKYILLLRVEDQQGRSVFALARSDDGYHFEVAPEPVMEPADEEPFRTYERRGIEDPRITPIDGMFYIVYTAYSQYDALLALAKTSDFQTFERIALISEPENKDGCLFPARINGRYARLDRPMASGQGNIWISYSEDLLQWHDSRVMMTARGGYWDADRVGASVPPVETKDGWLEIYHGVKNVAGGPVYKLGAVLLDLEDPLRILGRTAIAILSPREYYERIGDVGNVVFSCGAVRDLDDTLKVYYGAGDTCICVGTASVQSLVSRCEAANSDE